MKTTKIYNFQSCDKDQHSLKTQSQLMAREHRIMLSISYCHSPFSHLRYTSKKVVPLQGGSDTELSVQLILLDVSQVKAGVNLRYIYNIYSSMYRSLKGYKGLTCDQQYTTGQPDTNPVYYKASACIYEVPYPCNMTTVYKHTILRMFFLYVHQLKHTLFK